MKRTGALALAVAAAITAAAVEPAQAGTQFLAYQGPDAVKQGRGGDMKTVDGVDFWLDGSPPRRFQVLGVVEDERLKTGIIGLIRMSSLERDMARMVHSAGGDAVILTDARDDVLGISSTSFGGVSGSAFGTGSFVNFSASGSSTTFARPVESRASRYVVVRYLPEDPSVAPAPAWSVTQPSPPDAPPPAVTTSRF
jgi:hypothetical protein